MPRFRSRDLAAEVSKHFRGTAEERILIVRRLGEEAVDLHLASLPPGTTRREARLRLRRSKTCGRLPSAVAEAP